ncbi:MAG: hypothetical protein ACE5JS_01805 [Nitrospinota bacterium]
MINRTYANVLRAIAALAEGSGRVMRMAIESCGGAALEPAAFQDAEDRQARLCDCGTKVVNSSFRQRSP